MKKKKYELNIDQYTFISNCRDFLIQPIADKSIYYGVLSLYFKFTQIVQDIAIKKKDANYNKNKEKLENKDSTNNEKFKSEIINGNIPKKEGEDIIRSKTASNMKNNLQTPGNNENINIIFIIEKSKKLLIQAQNTMSVKSLINRFNQKTGYDNNYIKKYLIDDKINLDPSSTETLQEKQLADYSQIMAYKE